MSAQRTRALRGQRDTGAARLPGLPAVSTGNVQLDAWITAATERLEVREGQRGNGFERAVTVRELKEFEAQQAQNIVAQMGAIADGTNIAISVGGMTATMAIKKFEDAIRATKLYQDLKKRLDDPSRFDDLRAEVREELLRDLTKLALEQGAKVERVERIIAEHNLQIAMRIETVTAAAANAAAGAREVMFATAERDRAQAGKITQLEASITAQSTKTAKLEQQMTVTADKVQGLSGQYTLKIQAGGALAGFGLAATEKDGKPDSAFIIAANKFAIVNPSTWSAGLTNTPDQSHIPFGVDANGIYLNNNVYVKGLMRVDTAGKTLADGLRGSLDANGGTGNWNDNTARNTIWKALGKSGNATNNNHLVIGDTVTIGSVTKQWMGSSWAVPGIVINGDMLVNGTIAGSKIAANTVTADKIDSRGLTIKDSKGNVIFGASQNLNVSRILGLGDLATQDTVSTGQLTGNLAASRVSGLGTLATQNTVNIAANTADSMVTIGGQKISASQLLTSLNKLDSTNISTFMKAAAIGGAYIGNAAVGTLKIAGNAVTVPVHYSRRERVDGTGWERSSATPYSWVEYLKCKYTADEDMHVTMIVCTICGNNTIEKTETAWTRVYIPWVYEDSAGNDWNTHYNGSTFVTGFHLAKNQSITVYVYFGGHKVMSMFSANVLLLGTKR